MRKMHLNVLIAACISSTILSCSKKDGNPATANPDNDPRAGSRWVYRIISDQTYAAAPPSHYEGDIEWLARDTTINDEKWLSITEKNLSVSGGSSTTRFAIRRGDGGWRCKILNTPKEGLWLASTTTAGTFYQQTHPPKNDNMGFNNRNDVTTEVINVINLTTTEGVLWQNVITATFDLTSSGGDIHQVQSTLYHTDGPLMIKNVSKETNAAAGYEENQSLELKNFTR